MRPVTCSVCLLALAPAIGLCGSSLQPGPQLPDVCEVLADPNLYNGKEVAVVGRMEHSVSITDHYEFLSQDRCRYRLTKNHHNWADSIQIWVGEEEGMPKAPSDMPKFDQAMLREKLAFIRRTTKLGSHKAPGFKTQGNTLVYDKNVIVPNEWAVVYGRLIRLLLRDEDCLTKGCVGDVRFMIVAKPYDVYSLAEDGRLLPEPK